jgi:signal transduction histidine kinase
MRFWVTKGIVEKHGGFIQYRSRVQAPSGTIFRIVLPRDKGAQRNGPNHPGRR